MVQGDSLHSIVRQLAELLALAKPHDDEELTAGLADFVIAMEREWQPESGFFWKELPRRLVSVLWYIPIFMSWQIERIREKGGDERAYARAVATATNEIERLLETP